MLVNLMFVIMVVFLVVLGLMCLRTLDHSFSLFYFFLVISCLLFIQLSNCYYFLLEERSHMRVFLYFFILLYQVSVIWFLEFVLKSHFATRHDIVYFFCFVFLEFVLKSHFVTGHDIVYNFWLFLLLISRFPFCC